MTYDDGMTDLSRPGGRSRVWEDHDGGWCWEVTRPDGTSRGVCDTKIEAETWVLAAEHPDLRVKLPPSKPYLRPCGEHDLRGITPQP